MVKNNYLTNVECIDGTPESLENSVTIVGEKIHGGNHRTDLIV